MRETEILIAVRTSTSKQVRYDKDRFTREVKTILLNEADRWRGWRVRFFFNARRTVPGEIEIRLVPGRTQRPSAPTEKIEIGEQDWSFGGFARNGGGSLGAYRSEVITTGMEAVLTARRELDAAHSAAALQQQHYGTSPFHLSQEERTPPSSSPMSGGS